MTNLEPVLTDDTTRRNFAKLEDLYTRLAAQEALLTALLAGKKIRTGTGVLTFTASSASAVLTVAHGLGTTPSAVFLTAAQPANIRAAIQESAAADATNISIAGFTTNVAVVTTTQNFYWLVIS